MNLFESLAIVLEADDITKEVKKEQKQLNTDVTDDGSKDDMSKTNDIFDLENDKSDNNKDVDDTPDDTTDDETDEDNLDVDGGDDGIDGEDEDLPTDDAIPEETPELKQKLKLRENMILFYNIITSNINLLQEYRPTKNNKESTYALFNIISNLTDCKNMLYIEITESFSTKSYPLLLKTYISISRVYDLCQKSLELYFDNVKLIDNATRNKNKQQKI